MEKGRQSKGRAIHTEDRPSLLCGGWLMAVKLGGGFKVWSSGASLEPGARKIASHVWPQDRAVLAPAITLNRHCVLWSLVCSLYNRPCCGLTMIWKTGKVASLPSCHMHRPAHMRRPDRPLYRSIHSTMRLSMAPARSSRWAWPDLAPQKEWMPLVHRYPTRL